MKKSKILKLLVSALSLCLIIGAMVGITAMAETDPGDSKNPEIFSYNVSYSDSLYLYYAVKAELAEGESIYLQLCDAKGNALTEVDGYDFANPDKKYEAKITKYTEQIVHDEKVYVFVTNGVAAKDIDKSEYVKAVIVEADGNTRESELVQYSVLSYLYQRLYVDGIALATDGENLIRKDLYQSLVAYGASAQELLLADELQADEVSSIRSSRYQIIDGVSKSIIYKSYVRPDAADLPEVADQTFVGWKATSFDEGSVLDGTLVYRAGSTFECYSAIVLTPVYVADGEDAPELNDVYTDGVERFDSLEVPSTVKIYAGMTAPTIVEDDDGNRAIYYAGQTSGSWGWLAFTTDGSVVENANTFVFECDIKTEEFGYFAMYIAKDTGLTDSSAYTRRLSTNKAGSFSIGDATGVNNEWCHFKAEYVKYTKDGATQGYFRITITSEAYGKTVQEYALHGSDTIDLSTATAFTFSYQSSGTPMKNTYFDNVKVYKYCNESLVEAPAA